MSSSRTRRAHGLLLFAGYSDDNRSMRIGLKYIMLIGCLLSAVFASLNLWAPKKTQAAEIDRLEQERADAWAQAAVKRLGARVKRDTDGRVVQLDLGWTKVTNAELVHLKLRCVGAVVMFGESVLLQLTEDTPTKPSTLRAHMRELGTKRSG